MRTASLRRPRLLVSLSAAAVVALAGAAQAQAQTLRAARPPSAMSPYAKSMPAAKTVGGAGDVSDPFESVNRKIFLFNGALDKVVIRPLAVFWHHAAPKPLREGINNFLSNLGEPVVFINDVLQGHPAIAAATATRFAANSTIGLLGVIDVTGKTGLPHHDNGFGLTLGRWGFKSGPYLMLPLLGPSSVRDGFGQLGDLAANPLTYTRSTGNGGLTTGLGVVGGLDARADADSDLKALQALATDQYAALRSFYLQNRQAQVTGGKIDLDALPNFDDPGTAPAPAPAPAKTADAISADPASVFTGATAPASGPAGPAPSASLSSEVFDSGVQVMPETDPSLQAVDDEAPPPATPKGV